MSAVGSTSIVTPKIVRTGGSSFDAYTLPPYPKWVVGVGGKMVLVRDEQEALVTKASADKAAADAAEVVAKAELAAAVKAK